MIRRSHWVGAGILADVLAMAANGAALIIDLVVAAMVLVGLAVIGAVRALLPLGWFATTRGARLFG